MELNDTSDYQQCFVCGQRNPYGLQMSFRQEGETVVADFRPKAEHQGFPGVIHGGIVAAVLDEALNRTCALSNNPAWSMTARLEVRYRRYVPYGVLLRVRAKLEGERGRLLQASGIITLAEDETKILTEGQGSFMTLSAEMSKEVMSNYPEMRDFFKKQQA